MKTSKGHEEIKMMSVILNCAVNSRSLHGSLWGITLGLSRRRARDSRPLGALSLFSRYLSREKSNSIQRRIYTVSCVTEENRRALFQSEANNSNIHILRSGGLELVITF
jgi:hypothetical protein